MMSTNLTLNSYR